MNTVETTLIFSFSSILLLWFSTCDRHTIRMNDWSQYSSQPFVIPLEIPAPIDSAGGIIAADLNNDGLMDYLVTVRGHIAAYANNGRKLWIKKTDVRIGGSSEKQGLPGHHGPGIQATDIDHDGKTEVLYLTQDSALHVVAGLTGCKKWKVELPVPVGAERWEHLVVADFRGKGNRDILLQATNAKGYRMGQYLAAYKLADLRRGKFKPLWSRSDFVSCAHNGTRVADLNMDGRDEVLGQMILGPDGEILCQVPFKGHTDSIVVADIRPDIQGLEVVILEEHIGENHICLYNAERIIWKTHYNRQEPQNVAVGEFDCDSPGLEVWCRSRSRNHQKPFVFNAEGQLISAYEMDDVAPKGWNTKGVDVIWTIDWTGAPTQLCAAKERGESGDVAIFEPVTGRFICCFKEQADRLYVADVSGDWREELIVLSGNEIHVYHNDKANPYPNRPRLWSQAHYRRSKMTWNYYSP